VKLDPRFVLPAALTTLAVAIPAAPAAATPPTTFTCPDGFMPVPAAYAPDKDKNGDGIVCAKITNPASKDDNSNPNSGFDLTDILDDTIV
jgi:hypothetical protein